jgi:transcriptional regulator with XRE-family HTH domain
MPARRLRRALTGVRWSAPDLAALTGVSVSTARRWIVGEAVVPAAVLAWVEDRADDLELHPPPRWSEQAGWLPPPWA